MSRIVNWSNGQLVREPLGVRAIRRIDQLTKQMSLFIAVHVDEARCRKGQPCTACIAVCPVSIFEGSNGLAGVVEAHEDECILCDLCLRRCPTDAIVIHKLYSGEVLTTASPQGGGR